MYRKSRLVLQTKSKGKKIQFRVFQRYFTQIAIKLFHLGNPFGLTLPKYVFIKYFLSTISFFVLYIRDQNIVASIFCFMLFFLFPNIVIAMYKRGENLKIINEISNVVQSMILSVSCNMTIHDALKTSISSINYQRFQKEFENFVNQYVMYHFNMAKAAELLKEKFDSYECNMLVSILIQGEREGNMLEILETFYDSLEALYFKYLKYRSSQKMLLVSLATIISLINSFIIVLYPIVTQIMSHMEEIFR